ncbi:MAG TPA: histidinol-phosphate transaminase [Bacteroidales bacterium]|jgi:histidinol-phosphate aminotransferase|nr:histidinol-phosphate transaminase [Bacteroidales bacterium]
MKNTFSISHLLRKNIQQIKPYSTARDEYSGVALINLDANENPFGSIDGSLYNRYPDPYQIELKKRISQIKNVPVENMFLGNGSDEGIDLLYTAFCNPGVDNVILCPPTYGMYKVSADTNDILCKEVALTEDFQLQVSKILDSIDEYTKIIWLCSPNNPTANLLRKSDIQYIVEKTNCLVVIDEAYIDFASEPSWIHTLHDYSNVVVLQTFSKAWGLANIRLGMLFASQEIIAVLNKIKLPYNISGLVQEYALKVLSGNLEAKDIMVEQIIQEREKMAETLTKVNGVRKVYPSDANFLLVKIDNAHQVYLFLVDKGIIVRDRSKIVLCEDSLRITIGTPQENTMLIAQLREFNTKR